MFNNGLHGWHLSDEEEYKLYYPKMLDFLKSEFSGKPIIIVLTTEILTTQERRDRVVSRNKIALQLAKDNNLKVIDLYSVSKANPHLFTEDNIHLTPEGYKILAQEILKTVEKIVF